MYPNRCMSTSIWDMSTSIWDTKLQTGGRGYLMWAYMLFNVGSRDVDTWTQTSLYAEDRGLPSTDDPGPWQYKCFFRSYDLLDWSTLILSENKTHLPKDKTYIWVSVWWKTKNERWGIYTSPIHWVVRGTGTPKDKDEVNRRDVYECDGWVCFLKW